MGECSFWYRPTRVVPDQRPLNGRCCCCSLQRLFTPGAVGVRLSRCGGSRRRRQAAGPVRKPVLDPHQRDDGSHKPHVRVDAPRRVQTARSRRVVLQLNSTTRTRPDPHGTARTFSRDPGRRPGSPTKSADFVWSGPSSGI